MRIQPVQNGDLLFLSKIEKELFEENAFGVFLLLHYLQTHVLFEKIIDNSDDIIGFGIVTRFNPAVLNPHEIRFIEDIHKTNHQIAHLVDFAIRKKFWDLGYGTTLLRHLITSLIKKKFEYLYLEVDSSNSRAVHFYISNGFREIGTIKSYYSTGNDAILQLKKLEIFS